MIEDKDYKDVVIDNDAIVNTAPAELPTEPQNIPQGEKPELNPNPGYGEDGETKPAIKTELVEGESGTPVIENTNQNGVKVERDPTNFVGGLYINGKSVKEYVEKYVDIKSVSSFEINASGHLIVNYDDGTTQDLGAIFSGNVNIDGNFTANSIIENMSGYSFIATESTEEYDIEYVYVGAVKNGNKLTIVISLNITRLAEITSDIVLGRINIPQEVIDKLFPTSVGGGAYLDLKVLSLWAAESTYIQAISYFVKSTNYIYAILKRGALNSAGANTQYYLRYEATFLLSDNLAS